MAEGWYCKIADQELGPLSADQLRALVSQRRISPNDAVRREGSDCWAPAGRVKGLFPKSTVPSNSSPSSSPNASVKPLPRAKPIGQPPATSQTPAQAESPTARPVSPNPDQSTAPCAIPVARPPGGLDQFSIVTDDTSPVGAGGQTGGPSKIAGKKNRRRTMLLASGGAVLAVGLAVGSVALYLSANDDSAEASKQSEEGGIPDDIVLTEGSAASVNSSGTSTPTTTSSSGDSSDDYPAAAFGGEGSLRSEIPAEMIVLAEESEPEGKDRVEPSDAESADREKPKEEIPARGPIPIPGLQDDE